MGISVVIPCYRSRDSLPILVPRLAKALSALTDEYEIILVVDGSPDDTFAVAHTLELSDPEHVRSILLNRNYGQGNASVAGVLRARYPITVTMDDDLQHNPDEIRALIAPLEDPLVDLVYGHSVEEEHGLFRNLASKSLKVLLSKAGVPDAGDMSSFRAFRTNLREGFAHSADSFAVIDVLLSWTTTAVAHVDVHMEQRSVGKTGYTIPKLFAVAFNLITGYSVAPLRFVTWLGGLCALFGFVMLVKVLVEFLLGIVDVSGWPTLAGMLALFSGAIMLSLGIIGEYLGRLHFRSMQQPTYLVRVESDPQGPHVGSPGLNVPHLWGGPTAETVAAAQTQRVIDEK